MKKNEVQLGGTYKCKVSGKIVSVKITHENPHGGWDAKNLSTGKNIKIKSAQRLRGTVNRPAKRKKIVSLAEYEAEAKAEIAASKGTTPAEKRDTGQRGGKGAKRKLLPYDTVVAAAQDAEDKRRAKIQSNGDKPAPQPGDNSKPLSLIKAAVCVLQSCERPMGCKEIIDMALNTRIWDPPRGGLTPANTLSAALRREIKTKGNDSRFVMAERGKFTLTSVKGA